MSVSSKDDVRYFRTILSDTKEALNLVDRYLTEQTIQSEKGLVHQRTLVLVTGERPVPASVSCDCPYVSLQILTDRDPYDVGMDQSKRRSAQQARHKQLRFAYGAASASLRPAS
jgi:hypothetical protein